MCWVFSAGVSSCKNILQLSVDGVYPEKSHGAPSQLASYWSMFLTETSDWLSHPPSEYNLSPFPSVAKEYTSTSQKIKQFFSFLNIQKLYCRPYVMIKSEASVQVTWCLQVLLPLCDLGWLRLRVRCLDEARLSPQHPLPSAGLQWGKWRTDWFTPTQLGQVKNDICFKENMSQIKSG